MMAASANHSGVAISQLLDGLVLGSNLPERRVSGITANSRAVKPGDLFIAQAGLTRHAIDFAGDALEAGAAAVLFDPDDEYSVKRVALLRKQHASALWIAVPQLQARTGHIASRFYDHPSRAMQLVGVTLQRIGSNHLLDNVGREAVDNGDQLVAPCRVLFFTQPYESLAQGFNGLEDLGVLVLDQNVTKQVAEHFYPRAKFLVGGRGGGGRRGFHVGRQQRLHCAHCIRRWTGGAYRAGTSPVGAPLLGG